MLEDAINKITEKMSDVLAALANFAKENPKLIIAIMIVVLIIVLLSTMLSSCAIMMPSTSDGVLVSTYTAYDESIPYHAWAGFVVGAYSALTNAPLVDGTLALVYEYS